MFVNISEFVFVYIVEFSLSLALVNDEAFPPVVRKVECVIFCGDSVVGVL